MPLLEDTNKNLCTPGPRGKEQWHYRRLNQSIEKRVKHKQKNEDSRTDFCIKCTLTLYGVPEGEEREKESKKIFEEIIAENFVNMVKEIVN